MDALRVRLLTASTKGRLLYHYDPQTQDHLLLLKSPFRASLSYTVNINGGAVLLGLDDTYTLRDVEVIFPKRNWIISALSLPKSKSEADIAVVGVERQKKLS